MQKSTHNKSECIPYYTYIKDALYHPTRGYYTQNKRRVGKTHQADFYTASSIAPLFQQLLLAAAENILNTCGANPATHTFIEIGPEPGHSLFETPALKDTSPFKNHLSLPLNVNESIPQRLAALQEKTSATTPTPPKYVLFFNEVLDAQPFERLIFKNNTWHVRRVQQTHSINHKATFTEADTTPLAECGWTAPHAQNILESAFPLPHEAPENYELDVPTGAEHWLHSLCQSNFSGLVLTLDYGKTWNTLAQETPAGTARTYLNHTLEPNLLAHPPGTADITHHVAWCRLQHILHAHNFKPQHTQCLRQESFFMHHSANTVQRIMEHNIGTPGHTQATSALRELLHPAHMGAQFSALWGYRA